MTASLYPETDPNDYMTSVWEQFKIRQTRQETLGRERMRCEEEVIVQGDEGPVRGVAQVVDCHGVTGGHEEREEEVEERQVAESDGEKTLKDEETCAWMG